MKRHLIRLGALGLVVGLGWYAITWSMNSSNQPQANAPLANTEVQSQNTTTANPTTTTSPAKNQSLPQTQPNLHQPNRISTAEYTTAKAPQTNLVGGESALEIPSKTINNLDRYRNPLPSKAGANNLTLDITPVQPNTVNQTFKNPQETIQPTDLRQPSITSAARQPAEVILQPQLEVSANNGPANNGPTNNNQAPAKFEPIASTPISNQPQAKIQNQPTLIQPTAATGSAFNQPAIAKQPAVANSQYERSPDNPSNESNENNNQFRATPRNFNNTTAAIGTTAAAANTAANTVAHDTKSTPGEKKLEGVQAPSLTLEKTAPKEIQVGRPALFEIKVRNTGNVAAHDVQVADSVPKGTTLISTTPQAQTTANSGILWKLGTLKAGESKRLKIELMPRTEGEIGSVASITFRTQATARTIATRPRLTLEVTNAPKVMIGKQVDLEITVTNPGSGVASSVTIENNVPKGLKHPGGSEIEFEIGDLKPGEKRSIKLSLTAIKAGQIVSSLLVRAEGNLKVEKKISLEVIAPGLKVSISGPRLRYLERKATYKLSIHNPGTAAAKDVELVAYLPQGMKFVEASNSGEYDKAEHAVFWSLEELPPAKSGDVTLTTIPTIAGIQTLKVEGSAEKGLKDTQQKEIMVQGIVALSFEVLDVQDPIELDGEVVYEVRVINRGTKTANNIKVDAILPIELKAVSGKGPTAATTGERSISFAPLARLAPKADTTFTIRARAIKTGDLRINIQVKCDEMPQPVTRQESTRVFTNE